MNHWILLSFLKMNSLEIVSTVQFGVALLQMEHRFSVLLISNLETMLFTSRTVLLFMMAYVGWILMASRKIFWFSNTAQTISSTCLLIKSISFKSTSVVRMKHTNHALIVSGVSLGSVERDVSKHQYRRWRMNSLNCMRSDRHKKGIVSLLKSLGKPSLKPSFLIRKPMTNSKPLKTLKQIWKVNNRWIGLYVVMSDTERQRLRSVQPLKPSCQKSRSRFSFQQLFWHSSTTIPLRNVFNLSQSMSKC